jgi:hypothetical protein
METYTPLKFSSSICRFSFSSKGIKGIQHPKPTMARNWESQMTKRFFFQLTGDGRTVSGVFMVFFYACVMRYVEKKI